MIQEMIMCIDNENQFQMVCLKKPTAEEFRQYDYFLISLSWKGTFHQLSSFYTKMLEYGFSFNQDALFSALSKAANFGKHDNLRFLLAEFMKTSRKDIMENEYNNLFYQLVEFNNLESIKILFENGIKITQFGESNSNDDPIGNAVFCNNAEIFEYFIQQFDNREVFLSRCFFQAIYLGKIRIAEIITNAGFDVQTLDKKSRKNLLDSAYISGEIEILKYLEQFGFDYKNPTEDNIIQMNCLNKHKLLHQLMTEGVDLWPYEDLIYDEILFASCPKNLKYFKLYYEAGFLTKKRKDYLFEFLSNLNKTLLPNYRLLIEYLVDFHGLNPQVSIFKPTPADFKVVESDICPISMEPLVNPLACSSCRNMFSKKNIMAWIFGIKDKDDDEDEEDVKGTGCPTCRHNGQWLRVIKS